MKHDPVEAEVRALMEPGILSKEGFLGNDERNIIDIIKADAAVFEAAEISLDDLADVLQAIFDAANAAMGNKVKLFNDQVEVHFIDGMGQIPCPFRDGEKGYKGVIHVRFDGKKIKITPLHIHLVRTHGFLQGHGSPFRFEPADAIRLLELAKA